MSTIAWLGGAASAVMVASFLIGGIWWLIRRLMGLAVWLSAINSNTKATVDLRTEAADLKAEIQGLRGDLREETKQRRAEIRDLMERMQRLEEKVS